MNLALIAIEQVLDLIKMGLKISQLYYMVMRMDYIVHSLIRLMAIVTRVECGVLNK